MSAGLTQEQVDLLKIGARTRMGRICSVGEKEHSRAMAGLERRALAYDDGTTWWIRDAGRAAIGAPSYDEMAARELATPLVAGRAC